MTPEKMYTAIQVARMLGRKVDRTKSTYHRLGYLVLRPIPGAFKIGNKWFIKESDLTAYIEQKKADEYR